jgi:hypothetical protein
MRWFSAAAGTYGVLLRQAQARKGLARVDDARARALDGIGVQRGLGGDRAQQLKKVERGALGREQRAGGAFDLEHDLVGGAALAFGATPLDAHLRVELPQRGLDPGRAAHHGGFARQHAGTGAVRLASTSDAVRSPSATSSCRARVASDRASAATADAEKSKRRLMALCLCVF